MKVNVVRAHTIDVADQVFTPYDDSNHRHYLRERSERTQQLIRDYGGASADRYLERSKRMFEEYNSTEALRRNRAAMRAARGSRSGDNILRLLSTVEDIQTCNLETQRFAMAHERTRALFKKQLVDGYRGSYEDLEEGIGVDHSDFRLATHGMVMNRVNAAGEEELFVRHFYDPDNKERPRDPIEQDTIADMWEIMMLALDAGIDPSNPLGGTVG